MDLSVTVQDVTVSPSSMVRNLSVILDDGLSCTPNITAEARSCRFVLYNIRWIDSDVVFLSCDKCTYCKSLWTKASAECPQCKCEFKCKCKWVKWVKNITASYLNILPSDLLAGSSLFLLFWRDVVYLQYFKVVLCSFYFGGVWDCESSFLYYLCS